MRTSGVLQSLSALPSCLQKFLQFPKFFTPGYSFWRRTRIRRDPGSKIFFLRISCYFRTDYPLYGHTKTKIMKSVPTFHDHNFASFWARDSSKKALFSSWLALSNGMKSEGSAGRAVHVQGDWKLCTCTARRKKIFKPGSRWIRVLRQKLYPGVKNLGNWRNFCKQLGSALSDSTT